MESDKELEKLVKQMMDEVPLEAPSSNFTHLVMQEIQLQKSSVRYKPLLTKSHLILTAGIISVLLLYGFMDGSGSQLTSGAYWEFLMNTRSWFSDRIPELQFSKTLSYTVASIGIMVCFQALILKRYFNNRFA